MNASDRGHINPELKCQASELVSYARRYQYPIEEAKLVALRPRILNRGWMLKEELRSLAHWKAPRSAKRMETNPDEYIKDITALAFGAATERTRIEVLTVLDGVQWPTASVILHLFHRQPYPIIDFRALWSVSLPEPKQYTFDFWWTYVEFCRTLANRLGLDMRTLDKALWQYSKEHQPTT